MSTHLFLHWAQFQADKSMNYLSEFCIQNNSFKSFSLPFFSCLEKEVTVFRWYCSAGLQKELWVWPHFHCEADKDASSHTGDNVLTPVNHLFPNFITLRLFSVKTQSPDAEHPNSLSDCAIFYLLLCLLYSPMGLDQPLTCL